MKEIKSKDELIKHLQKLGGTKHDDFDGYRARFTSGLYVSARKIERLDLKDLIKIFNIGLRNLQEHMMKKISEAEIKEIGEDDEQ